MSLQPTKKVVYVNIGLTKSRQPLRKQAFSKQRGVTTTYFKVTDMSYILPLSFKVALIAFVDDIFNFILRVPQRSMELFGNNFPDRYTSLLDFRFLTS